MKNKKMNHHFITSLSVPVCEGLEELPILEHTYILDPSLLKINRHTEDHNPVKIFVSLSFDFSLSVSLSRSLSLLLSPLSLCRAAEDVGWSKGMECSWKTLLLLVCASLVVQYIAIRSFRESLPSSCQGNAHCLERQTKGWCPPPALFHINAHLLSICRIKWLVSCKAITIRTPFMVNRELEKNLKR